jgi:PPOX class probable FMN-dependent enzyme
MNDIGDFITTEEQLRALYGAPKKLPALAKAKEIDDLCRRFFALSPLLCISSCDRDGHQDVSPRGDAPGFVQVLDPATIAIPDRPGNNKLETLSNILGNPRVALLFIIPGHEEMLRLNGTAKISRDPALLARSAVEGRLPKAMIVIKVEEIYPHCGKALRRARIWDSQSRPKQPVPSLAAIALTMAGLRDRSVEEVAAQVEKGYETELY